MTGSVPFYEEYSIRLSPADRSTEFCGSQSHEYELHLAIEDIDYSRTKTKSPQTLDRRELEVVVVMVAIEQ